MTVITEDVGKLWDPGYVLNAEPTGVAVDSSLDSERRGRMVQGLGLE